MRSLTTRGAAMLLTLAGLGTGAAAQARPVSPEQQIRAGRAASNAAIAAHDVSAMRQYAPDFTILPGSSGAPLTLDAFTARMKTTFADPTFITYVRTPNRVQIGRSGRRAVETGRGTGIWRKPDGEMRMTGVYQAMWVPTAAGWRLRNESFVTLACVGSNACAGLD